MEKILEVKNITKTFPGVVALDDVSFSIGKGEVHGLVGENGAGKSTLMKILCGVYQADSGKIVFDGQEMKRITPTLSQKAGISIIFQEFNLLRTLSIAENIFVNRLSDEDKKTVNWEKMNKKAEKILSSIGYSLDVKREVGTLSVAECQMVEIAKALSYDAKLILMDEPSATLTSKELETLFSVIDNLRKKGITIVYISHKLDEIYQLCDNTTVMRDGKVIDTKPTCEYTRDELIHKMVGRSVENEYPQRPSIEFGEEVLRVENLNLKKKNVRNINFNLKRGEILGIVGLVGSGRTEIVRAIFGADKRVSGDIYINGKKVNIKTPQDAIANKLVLLTENRRDEGLFLKYPIKSNISATCLKKIKGKLFIDKKKETDVAKKYIEDVCIKCPSEEQKVLNLSGGNQQKVVISKWMFAEPDVLIMDEPTRGIDVGAKYEIYVLINKLTEMGKSIIFISSEIQEVLAVSDRVIVIHEGAICGEVSRDEYELDEIMKYAIGSKELQ